MGGAGLLARLRLGGRHLKDPFLWHVLQIGHLHGQAPRVHGRLQDPAAHAWVCPTLHSTWVNDSFIWDFRNHSRTTTHLQHSALARG